MDVLKYNLYHKKNLSEFAEIFLFSKTQKKY